VFLYYVVAEQDYEMAIKLYTDAINLNPFVASYYGNRSFAYIKTECYGYGLTDANKALELDRTYVKVGTIGVINLVIYMPCWIVGISCVGIAGGQGTSK